MKTFFAKRKMVAGLIAVFFLVIGSGAVHAQSMPSAMMETVIYSQYGNVKPEAFHRVFEQWQKAEYGRVRNSFDQSEVKNVAQSFTLWVVYNDPFTEADYTEEHARAVAEQARQKTEREARRKAVKAIVEEAVRNGTNVRGVVCGIDGVDVYYDIDGDGQGDYSIRSINVRRARTLYQRGQEMLDARSLLEAESNDSTILSQRAIAEKQETAAEKQAAAAAEEERLKSIGWRGVVVEVKDGGRKFIDLNEDGKADVFFYTINSGGIKVGSVIYVKKEVWSPGTSTQRSILESDVLKIYP